MASVRSFKVAEYKVHILLFVAVILLLFYGCSHLFGDLCVNQILSETYSPNKQLKAVVFRRDCGATTNFSTQVSIMNSWEKLDNGNTGTVFVTDSSAVVKWNGDGSLSIKYGAPCKIFTQCESHLMLPFFQMVRVKFSEMQDAN